MTIITDPDRPMELPRLSPDVPACEPWCHHQDSDDPSREHMTYLAIACMSDELFIPYAHGGRIKIEDEDRTEGDYPPFMPAFLAAYLYKDFGRDAEIDVNVSDSEGESTKMTLRLSEAADLMEVLARLLRAAGYPVTGVPQAHAQGWLDGFDHARLVHRTRRQRAARRVADWLTVAGRHYGGCGERRDAGAYRGGCVRCRR